MSTPLNGASSVSGDSRLTRLAVAKAKEGDAEGIHYLYVRYAGHAPDHPRNKAFAQRWGIE